MTTFHLPGTPRISNQDAWTFQQRSDIRAIWDDLLRSINNGAASGGCDCNIDGGAPDEIYTPQSDINGGTP